MGKFATTHTEQIELLQSRGMELDMPVEKVTEILDDVGYYRLGFYWHPFETDNHNFRPGTKFSTVVKLYYLDCDLRNDLLRYSSRIEIHFRTKVVYYASNAFKSSPVWFVDRNFVHSDFISKFPKTYDNKFRSRNVAIRKHHEKYINDRYAPAWKTLEYLTFGNIVKLFESIKDKEVKREICSSLGILSVRKFESLISTVLYLRNALAHGNVLFDLQLPKAVSELPEFKIPQEQKHNLYAGIRVMILLLESISGNRKRRLERRLEKIFSRIEDEAIRELIRQKIWPIID